MPEIMKSRYVLTITVIVLGLLGLALFAGGLWLVILGGSPYYFSAGLALLVAAALLQARQATILWWYALFLLATTAWAVAEVRFDWWQLVPRLALWLVIGLWLLTPYITRHLSRPLQTGQAPSVAPLWLGCGVIALVGVIACFTDYDNQYGQLPIGETAPSPANASVSGDWTAYGSTAYGTRYSPLTQITPDNVNKLKVAWTYETGDKPGPDDPTETTSENTPLKVGDTLFLCTPHSQVIALNASNGEERWRYDPKISSPVGFKHFEHMTCRGVSYHDDASYTVAPYSDLGVVPQALRVARVSAICPARVFIPTADARLIALDAATGKPCEDFGNGGTVDLRANIGPFTPGGYYSTSPPAVTRDLVIIGGHVTDNASTNEPSGVVRAFDIHDGHLVWAFDSGNPDKTTPLPEGQVYVRNSPNMWSIFSVDEALGLVYLPMGNQTPDQFGGQRTPEAEKLSAGVVALEIATGRLKWNYQFTHHDLWDMDVGGQPTLVNIKTAYGTVPSLVASTKQGSIYVLDRRTGEPVIPISEVPVPQGAVAGDHTAPTQPRSALNFSPAPMTEQDMWGTNPFDQLWCRVRFRSLRYDGMYTPPSLQGSLVFPGNFGVFDWGGVAVDPVKQVLFANPSYMAFQSRLIPRDQLAKTESTMATSETSGIKQAEGTPYAIELSPFLSPLGIPCQAPPWGYVAGVDLQSGKIAYKLKNGTIRDSAPLPIPLPLGVPSLGGPIVTAGGVAFLSGTLDYYVRGYEVRTGKKLWEARLPAGGQATPMTYADKNGKQFLLVTAGGHGSLGTRQGDYVVVYALPD